MSSHMNMKRHGWVKRQSGFTPTAIFDPPKPTQSANDPPSQSSPGNGNDPSNGGPSNEPTLIPGPSLPPIEVPQLPTPSQPLSSASPLPPSPSTSPVVASLPPPLLPSTTALASIPPQQSVVFVTQSSAVPSNTSLPNNSSSNTKSGVIAGGIIAALIAAAGIFFAATYFLRRAKQRREEAEPSPFDPQDFRKSAMILDDDAFRATPPIMAEWTRASPAPTFGTQYGVPPPVHYNNASGYDYNYNQGPYPAMHQGQYMNSPVSATSAHPMWDGSASATQPGAIYHHDQAQYATYAAPPQQAVNEAYLQRQPSVNEQYSASPPRALTSPEAASYPAPYQHHPSAPSSYPAQSPYSDQSPYPTQEQGASLGRQPSAASSLADHYLDLSRSSVSPYQARQYAEISQKLNSEVPNGLDTGAANKFVINQHESGSVGEEKEPTSPAPHAITIPVPSPFDDENAVLVEHFPAPPAFPTSRIESIAPQLPELHLRNGSSSSFRASDFGGPNEGGNEITVGKDKFVPLSSPLAASMPVTGPAASAPVPAPVNAPAVIPAPMQAERFKAPATAPAHSTEFGSSRENNDDGKKRPDTMFSIYDPSDAYGGI